VPYRTTSAAKNRQRVGNRYTLASKPLPRLLRMHVEIKYGILHLLDDRTRTPKEEYWTPTNYKVNFRSMEDILIHSPIPDSLLQENTSPLPNIDSTAIIKEPNKLELLPQVISATTTVTASQVRMSQSTPTFKTVNPKHDDNSLIQRFTIRSFITSFKH